MLKFKVGDVVTEKDPLRSKIIKYKVIDIFRNYWGQDVYEFESYDEEENKYGVYRPREIAYIAEMSMTLTDGDRDEKV